MNRRGFLRWGCAHCALLQAAAPVFAQASGGALPGAGTAWSPPPRFAAPDASSDEGGLWSKMAREEQRLRRSPFLIKDDALRAYVSDIACRLAGEHCPDVRVYVVRNALFNANMAPNGMMQVWSGLLLRMDNEAQLAVVVSHEIGHFMQRHALEQLRDAKARSAAAVLLAPFGLVGLAGQLALAFSMYGYSRDQEREADAIGLQLMAAAGYDTSQAAVVWGNLLAEVAARPGADATKASILFATHPPSEERRETLYRLATQDGTRGEQAFAEHLRPWHLSFVEDELKRGQYDETIALMDRKIVAFPKQPELLYCRGEALRLRGRPDDPDRALADLNAAIAMDDVPAAAHRSLGLLLRSRQDRDGAVAAFTRYLQAAPDAPDAGIINSYIAELPT